MSAGDLPTLPLVAGFEEIMKKGFEDLGLPFRLYTAEESATNVLALTDKVTREADGGQYRKYDGTAIPW